ncbi:MAG: crossover junction endodeoxyribonuclease RuvC [Nitrospirota bacterium]
MKTGSSGNTVRLNGVRVLGIDPGSRICGYGIIETVTGQTLLNSHNSNRSNHSTPYRYIASGRVEMSHASLHQRLKEIYDALSDIIREYRPTEAVVEKVFFAKGVKSALNLGHARGVSLLAATSGGLPIYEYSALEVKKAVVGYGRAEKRQVQQMVMVILDLKNALSPDSADALALSICHLNTMRLGRP